MLDSDERAVVMATYMLRLLARVMYLPFILIEQLRTGEPLAGSKHVLISPLST